ncbi:MAG TPA: hypothetical protein VF061_04365 [Gemmatimonadales bacterium]
MHALTSRQRSVVLALAATLLLAGCASGARPETKPAGDSDAVRLPPRTASAGPVEVQVTDGRIDDARASFAIELNNHTVDLTGDYARGSTLTVGNRAWGAPRWTGDGPGSHHRAGTLTFPSAGQPSGVVVLRIAGLPAPAELRWAGR